MSKPFPSLPAFFCCAWAVFCLLACQTPKSTAYFQTIKRDTILQNRIARDFDIKIKPGDRLAIKISSASTEQSGLFNTSPGGETGASGYEVDKNGNIQLYRLGAVKVAGLSRTELQNKLRSDLSPYLKDPVVTTQFANQRITVLGEVGSPGVIPITNDQITVLEAIGQSGDLTENAKRENILVIRQTEKGKEFHHVNLLDHSVFQSPYFFLQNEDVVYVEPEPKKEAAKVQQTLSYIISGISILSLILSRIR
jgi:polysaccharide biosynthesis/export protein